MYLQPKFFKRINSKYCDNTGTEWVMQHPQPTPPSELNHHVISGKLPEPRDKFWEEKQEKSRPNLVNLFLK